MYPLNLEFPYFVFLNQCRVCECSASVFCVTRRTFEVGLVDGFGVRCPCSFLPGVEVHAAHGYLLDQHLGRIHGALTPRCVEACGHFRLTATKSWYWLTARLLRSGRWGLASGWSFWICLGAPCLAAKEFALTKPTGRLGWQLLGVDIWSCCSGKGQAVSPVYSYLAQRLPERNTTQHQHFLPRFLRTGTNHRTVTWLHIIRFSKRPQARLANVDTACAAGRFRLLG